MFVFFFTIINLVSNIFSQEIICRSDTNRDGVINVEDLLNILTDFSTTNIYSDINNDS